MFQHTRTWPFRSALIVLMALTGTLSGQDIRRTPEEIFQGQHRAAALYLLSDDIKQIEDAPARCLLRVRLAKLILDKKIPSYSDSAVDIVLDGLDDISKNTEQFSPGQTEYFKGSFISILRLYAPEEARKAEKKYAKLGFSDFSEMEELNAGGDVTAIAHGIASRISRGEVPDDLVPLFLKINKVNPQLGNEILGSFLTFLGSEQFTDSNTNQLRFLGAYYLGDAAPKELKVNFIRFCEGLAQRLFQGNGTGPSVELSYDLLNECLPSIRELLPSEYDSAQGMILALGPRISAAHKDRDDAYRRIDDSKDKLSQAIKEANAAEGKDYQSSLWSLASQLALSAKNFRLAVDCRLKVNQGSQSDREHDNYLLNAVLPIALKENDYDSAEYVINCIKDDLGRYTAIFKTAERLAQTDAKTDAYDYLKKGLKGIQTLTETTATARVLLSAIPTALSISKSTGFDVASAAIKLCNHISADGSDKGVGTVERARYVSEILLPNAHNLSDSFRILSEADFNYADAVSVEIQSKYWRLASRIEVENWRPYPYPKDVSPRMGEQPKQKQKGDE